MKKLIKNEKQLINKISIFIWEIGEVLPIFIADYINENYLDYEFKCSDYDFNDIIIEIVHKSDIDKIIIEQLTFSKLYNHIKDLENRGEIKINWSLYMVKLSIKAKKIKEIEKELRTIEEMLKTLKDFTKDLKKMRNII